ncbi:alpha/beta hydrolase domain-containing protein [Anaeramoeba flamelloides]|uniref:Alpha/beta hydrolase domain-containing protein n=1 Tax=Anaeramoeba flamelloides TaxID=1746091 RepID=A0AAV8ADI0_9EUKA|nr:alpha/beta hydrolase domain-containing protein [Anaeramoeba flamelloides]
MGPIISQFVFRPPNNIPPLRGDNLFYTTTSNELRIPILKFTPDDEFEEEFKIVKARVYTSSESDESGDSDYGSFSKDRWSLTSDDESEKGKKHKKGKKKHKNQLKSSEQNNSSKTRNSDFSSEEEISKKKTKNKKKKNKKGKKKDKKKKAKVVKKERKKEFQNRKRLSIIFAHGNGESIYELKNFALRIAQQTNCNVYLFEYPGYPQSQGKSREKNCYRSAEAVYHWVINEKRVPAEDIIWFGHSLGTSVALEIASKFPCKGVFLMSPLLSIFRAVVKLVCNVPFDMFVNLKKAPEVKMPVMILHGKDDTIVSIKHGKKLYELFPNKFDAVYIKHAGHNNIESRFRDQFYSEFNRFISFLQPPEEKELTNENNLLEIENKSKHEKDKTQKKKKGNSTHKKNKIYEKSKREKKRSKSKDSKIKKKKKKKYSNQGYRTDSRSTSDFSSSLSNSTTNQRIKMTSDFDFDLDSHSDSRSNSDSGTLSVKGSKQNHKRKKKRDKKRKKSNQKKSKHTNKHKHKNQK